MRSAMDAARAMLAQSGFGLEFWDEAVTNYVYTVNLVSRTIDDLSPYEIWTGKKADIASLHRFGEPCFPHFMKVHQGPKLAPRASTGIFLGYSLDSPEYRILDPETNEIYGSAHVDFHHSVNWPSISISRFSEPIVRDAAETDDPRDLTYAL